MSIVTGVVDGDVGDAGMPGTVGRPGGVGAGEGAGVEDDEDCALDSGSSKMAEESVRSRL